MDFLQPIVNKVVEIRKGNIKFFSGGIDYYLLKREELNLEESEVKKRNDSLIGITKKEQKRAEAEKRQAKYDATKNILPKIKELEKEIEHLEKEEKKLEQALADPKTYSEPQKAADLNKDFIKVKNELAECMNEWEELSAKLLEIESKFD